MALIKESIAVDKEVLEKLKEGVNTSRFIRKDFDELVILKRDTHPKLLAANLKAIQRKYTDNVKKEELQMIIEELEVAAEIGLASTGVSKISHIYASQSNGEIIGTFIIHKYKPCGNSVVVDAIVISASQKLSVDWVAFGIEGIVFSAVGFLINPALGIEDVVGLLCGAIHLGLSYGRVKEALNETNAKALLLKVLVDKGLALIENDKLYLIMD